MPECTVRAACSGELLWAAHQNVTDRGHALHAVLFRVAWAQARPALKRRVHVLVASINHAKTHSEA